MPSFIFRVRTPDKRPHRIELHEFPTLDTALVQASRVARALVRHPVRRGNLAIGGTLDVENEANQAVAQLVLREVARQIS
jgi:hypothetical protein